MAAGEQYALRLDVAKAAGLVEGDLEWTDRGRGVFTARPEVFGDVVLARKDTPASYHLAVVVDDAFQEISHVTRGEDLLASTHVHRLLQALLALPEPLYLHHPLMLDESDGMVTTECTGGYSPAGLRSSMPRRVRSAGTLASRVSKASGPCCRKPCSVLT